MSKTLGLLKSKLSRKKAVLGTWNTLGAVLATDALAQSGLDFVIVDFEHGPLELNKIASYSAHAQVHGCAAIVRLPKPEAWMVQQALDQGADGLIVPHIHDFESAEAFVKSTIFSPEGTRGFTPFSRAGSYTGKKAAQYAEASNRNILRAVIIESLEGFENLEKITTIEKLDVIYFGAYDLSAAFGRPGDIYHPQVLKYLKDGIRKVRKAKKTAGGFVAHTFEDIRKIQKMGIDFITYGVDSNILLRDYAAAVGKFKGL